MLSRILGTSIRNLTGFASSSRLTPRSVRSRFSPPPLTFGGKFRALQSASSQIMEMDIGSPLSSLDERDKELVEGEQRLIEFL